MLAKQETWTYSMDFQVQSVFYLFIYLFLWQWGDYTGKVILGGPVKQPDLLRGGSIDKFSGMGMARVDIILLFSTVYASLAELTSK